MSELPPPAGFDTPSLPSPPPPPPSAGASGTTSGAGGFKPKRWQVISLAVFAVLILAAIVGSSSKSSSGSTSPTTATNSPPATTSTVDPQLALAAAASDAYLSAYNKMIKAENAGISEQNSSDPATSTAGINKRIAARQALDDEMNTINFPDFASADAQQVESTDAALESDLGSLSANTDSVDNFNAIFPTVTAAEASFNAANKALFNDLGLTLSN